MEYLPQVGNEGYYFFFFAGFLAAAFFFLAMRELTPFQAQ